MEEQVASQLMDRLASDPALRAEFQRDPQETVKKLGLDLDDQDREALNAIDWGSLSDEELVERVSKRGAASPDNFC